MLSSIILPCTRTSLTFGSFEVSLPSGISGKCQTTQSPWDKCADDRLWVENKQNLSQCNLGLNWPANSWNKNKIWPSADWPILHVRGAAQQQAWHTLLLLTSGDVFRILFLLTYHGEMGWGLAGPRSDKNRNQVSDEFSPTAFTQSIVQSGELFQFVQKERLREVT